jgi:hypothetical protein
MLETEQDLFHQASEVVGIEIEQSIPLLVFALCVNGKLIKIIQMTKFSVG